MFFSFRLLLTHLPFSFPYLDITAIINTAWLTAPSKFVAHSLATKLKSAPVISQYASIAIFMICCMLIFFPLSCAAQCVTVEIILLHELHGCNSIGEKYYTHLTTSIINLSPAQSLRIATLSHWNVTALQPSSSSSPIA